MKIRIPILLLAHFVLFGKLPAQIYTYTTDTSINYVRTWTAKAPLSTANSLMLSGLVQSQQATQYFDALGRPLQTVVKKGSLVTTDATNSSGSDTTGALDLVTPVLYDPLGNEIYKYLPFVANTAGSNSSVNDGVFKTNPYPQQAAFMNSQYGSQGSDKDYGYSQTTYEASTFSRVLEQFAPGASWAGTAGAGSEASRHSIKTKYLANAPADDVKIWTVTNGSRGSTINSSYTATGTYARGDLYKTITIDEEGKQVVEFKDKQGLILLKKVQLTAIADDGSGSGYTGWMCTYYVYDNLNNLRCVVQPEGVQTLSQTGWTFTSTLLQEQCFRYEYDYRNRMVVKKIPGAAEVVMVYDVKDRLVMSQDGNLRSQTLWNFTQYDVLNRPVRTGIISASNDPIAHWDNTGASYPDAGMLTGATALTETFYDHYGWITALGIVAIDGNYSTQHDSYFHNNNSADNSSFPYQQQNVKDSRTRGMVTGTRTNVLGTANYITTVTVYDDKARPIQVKTINNTGGVDIATTQYSWSGQPITVVSLQEKADAGSVPVTTITKYVYDALGRVTQSTQNTIDHNSSVQSGDKVLAQHQYDAIGQLKAKSLGVNSGVPVEIQNYEYNIRGWLLGVNRGYVNGTATHNFGFDLAYDKQANLTGTNSYVKALYNGNITGMTWRGKTGSAEIRRYDYDYDAANRLLKGDFTDFTNPANNTAYDIKMGDGITASSAYDLNGNILKMWQRGLASGSAQVIDDLTYTYQGSSNKLAKVTDAAAPTTGLGDFNNGSNVDDDYAYDVNGNLTLDKNKDISAISYNILNLPQTITVTGKGTITYLYAASGAKLSKVVDETGVGVKTTQYLGPLIFENNVLQHVATPEGRTRLASGSWQYDYFLKDHLGNVRMMLADDGNPLEETHYYPFGLTQKGISVTNPTPSLQNKYLYNGKDVDSDLDLNWYHYGARIYDPQIGRFPSVDPIGAKFAHVTPYNYAENEPVGSIDLWGLQRWKVNGVERTGPIPGWITNGKTAGFAMRHPNAAVRIGTGGRGSTDITGVAGRFARHFAEATNTPKAIGSESNALRHGIWSAMIRTEFDPSTTQRALNAHEGVGILDKQEVDLSQKFNVKGEGAPELADHIVDILNNNIGMGIAEANPNAGTKELAQLVLGEFRNNGLWTFSKDKDGNITISRTLISQSQYDTGMETINSLDNNGFTSQERQQLEEERKRERNKERRVSGTFIK